MSERNFSRAARVCALKAQGAKVVLNALSDYPLEASTGPQMCDTCGASVSIVEGQGNFSEGFNPRFTTNVVMPEGGTPPCAESLAPRAIMRRIFGVDTGA